MRTDSEHLEPIEQSLAELEAADRAGVFARTLVDAKRVLAEPV